MEQEEFMKLFKESFTSCNFCKYSKNLSEMLGCEKHRKIILEPKRGCKDWTSK